MKKLIYSMVALAMTAMTFTSCEDVPMPYNLPQKEDVKPLPEAKGSGTKEDPYNVAAALGKIKAQAANVNTEPMYVKGKIASISSVETATYFNATYYISDDGTATNQLCIFQSRYLGNKKFTSQEQIKVGDEVVVYGPFVNFNGNKPETVGKGATYLYSLNGKTEEGGNTGGETGTPKGDGTQASPFNAAAAAKAAKALDESGKVENVYITGIVSSVNDVNTQYGNATYAISDDGKEAGQFSVYRGLYLDGAKFTSADQIKVGQKVVILGTLVNYKGNTPQVAQGSKIISIDGNGGANTSKGLEIDFKKGVGEWTIDNKTKPAEVEKVWNNDAKYGMKATGFVGSTKKNYTTESWLVSPAFSLEGITKPVLSIHHALNFFKDIETAKKEAVVMISTDGSTWTELALSTYPEKLSWTYVDATIDLSAYAGKSKVQIALKYTSTDKKAGTWEVETISVK